MNLDIAIMLRGLLPYIDNIGSPALRRFLVKLVPYGRVQKLREIIDIMEKASVEILQSKKAALQLGDEALLKQVGRGKDIISILCVYPSYSAGLTRLLVAHLLHSEGKHEGEGRGPPYRVGTLRSNDVRVRD